MSKSQFRRLVDSLEKRTDERLDEEVRDIFRRYGWDFKRIIEQGSTYELETIDKWSSPKIREVIEDVWPILMPSLFQLFLEHCVYTAILDINPKNEDEDLMRHFDLLYNEILYPDLWRQFKEESMGAPEIGEEGWDTWGISKELQEEFKVANADIESRKEKIRGKMIEEYKEEIKLLREEGSLEAAREMEETLTEVENCESRLLDFKEKAGVIIQ